MDSPDSRDPGSASNNLVTEDKPCRRSNTDRLSISMQLLNEVLAVFILSAMLVTKLAADNWLRDSGGNIPKCTGN